MEDIEYSWQDKKENGYKNPRARKRKKITDEEYFQKLEQKES